MGLLSVGSKAQPKKGVLQIGDAGAKQLVQVKQAGEEGGLAAFFEKDKNGATGIIGPSGLPPFPSGMSRVSPEGGRKYVMDADRAEGYPEEYVPGEISMCIRQLIFDCTDIRVELLSRLIINAREIVDCSFFLWYGIAIRGYIYRLGLGRPISYLPMLVNHTIILPSSGQVHSNIYEPSMKCSMSIYHCFL